MLSPQQFQLCDMLKSKSCFANCDASGVRKTSEPAGGSSGGSGEKQSDSQKQYVRQLYGGPGALYVVREDYPGGSGMMMELPASRGTLVGLIKEGDPMGNKERCYVDNGGEDKGLKSGKGWLVFVALYISEETVACVICFKWTRSYMLPNLMGIKLNKLGLKPVS